MAGRCRDNHSGSSTTRMPAGAHRHMMPAGHTWQHSDEALFQISKYGRFASTREGRPSRMPALLAGRATRFAGHAQSWLRRYAAGSRTRGMEVSTDLSGNTGLRYVNLRTRLHGGGDGFKALKPLARGRPWTWLNAIAPTRRNDPNGSDLAGLAIWFRVAFTSHITGTKMSLGSAASRAPHRRCAEWPRQPQFQTAKNRSAHRSP